MVPMSIGTYTKPPTFEGGKSACHLVSYSQASMGSERPRKSSITRGKRYVRVWSAGKCTLPRTALR